MVGVKEAYVHRVVDPVYRIPPGKRYDEWSFGEYCLESYGPCLDRVYPSAGGIAYHIYYQIHLWHEAMDSDTATIQTCRFYVPVRTPATRVLAKMAGAPEHYNLDNLWDEIHENVDRKNSTFKESRVYLE